MFKKVLLTSVSLFCFLFSSVDVVTSAAEWSEIDPGQEINNDFYSVWGSAADDVYVVGTLGKKLHYDGNPAGTWVDQGKDSG